MFSNFKPLNSSYKAMPFAQRLLIAAVGYAVGYGIGVAGRKAVQSGVLASALFLVLFYVRPNNLNGIGYGNRHFNVAHMAVGTPLGSAQANPRCGTVSFFGKQGTLSSSCAVSPRVARFVAGRLAA